MSGPKVDMAAVRKQEKDKLIRERQRRLQLVQEIEVQLEIFQEAVKELCLIDTMDVPAQELMEQVNKTLQAHLETIRKANETFDVSEARMNLQQTLQEYREQLQTLQRRGAAIQERAQNEAQMRQASEELSGSRRRTIAFLQKKSDASPVAEDQRSQLESELKELMIHPGLNAIHKSTLLNFRRQLESGSIAAAENFHQVKAVIMTDLRKLEDAYKQYRLECFDSEPMPLSSFKSVDEIQQAIEITRERSTGNLEKEYIKRQIDQVMAKHGFNVIESQQLEQLNATGQTFYEVNENTAINVFVSNNSQVSMRVVGIGVSDTISAEEDDMLYEQQCSFCAMHPQITAELAMRGVLLTTKEHKAPDRRFNKKIIAKERGSQDKKRKLQAAQQRVLYRE